MLMKKKLCLNKLQVHCYKNRRHWVVNIVTMIHEYAYVELLFVLIVVIFALFYNGQNNNKNNLQFKKRSHILCNSTVLFTFYLTP